MKIYGYVKICRYMDDLRLGIKNCVFLNFKNYAKIPIIKIFNEFSLIICKQICIKLKI